jgi:hypothetical protein
VPEPPRETLSVTALIDSAVAAEGARDWPRVCHWLERLRATDPDNPSYKVALALGWHNLAWMGAPAGRERSATRTSLERIAAERRVLALLDSAAADATTPAEWAQALAYTGTAYKNMGLMTDALRVYTIVHMRAPGATPALTHAATLLAYLRDPQPRIAPSASPVLTEPDGREHPSRRARAEPRPPGHGHAGRLRRRAGPRLAPPRRPRLRPREPARQRRADRRGAALGADPPARRQLAPAHLGRPHAGRRRSSACPRPHTTP